MLFLEQMPIVRGGVTHAIRGLVGVGSVGILVATGNLLPLYWEQS